MRVNILDVSLSLEEILLLFTIEDDPLCRLFNVCLHCIAICPFWTSPVDSFSPGRL